MQIYRHLDPVQNPTHKLEKSVAITDPKQYIDLFAGWLSRSILNCRRAMLIDPKSQGYQ
jgi:hypothetical protein